MQVVLFMLGSISCVTALSAVFATKTWGVQHWDPEKSPTLFSIGVVFYVEHFNLFRTFSLVACHLLLVIYWVVLFLFLLFLFVLLIIAPGHFPRPLDRSLLCSAFCILLRPFAFTLDTWHGLVSTDTTHRYTDHAPMTTNAMGDVENKGGHLNMTRGEQRNNTKTSNNKTRMTEMAMREDRDEGTIGQDTARHDETGRRR